MATSEHRASRVVTALLLGLLAVIGTAAPAHAADPFTVDHFSIQRVAGGQCRVYATGAVQTDSFESARFLAARASFHVGIWGDDPSSDDHLYTGNFAPHVAVSDGRVVWTYQYDLRCGLLDEDDAFYDRNDEVYVRVRFWGLGTYRSIDSGNWGDYF